MTSQDRDIRDIFKSVSDSMKAELNGARCIVHPGEKGQINEKTFRDFLIKYLPKSLEVSTGIVIDTKGGRSKQLDIIISDASKTPVFYEKVDGDKKIRIVPIECVYAIIEVKTRLTNQEINDCLENMKSVKTLEKKAYVLPPQNLRINIKQYSKEWEIWPVNYYVFAYEGDNLQKLLNYLSGKFEENHLPVHLRIDSICILNRGLITNWMPNISKFEALPEDCSDLVAVQTEDSLLFFYLITSKWFFQTYLPIIMPVKYEPFIPFEVLYPEK